MNKYIRLIILAIALITMVSGLVQLISPALILNMVGAETTAATQHFFAIIGMFMLLFGGLLVHALYSIQSNHAAILWGALQKAGASLAVFIGIYHHLFSGIAALVAIFDGVSCLMLLVYYRHIRLPHSQPILSVH